MKKVLFIITTLFTIFILAITASADTYNMNYQLLYDITTSRIVNPSSSTVSNFYPYVNGYTHYHCDFITNNTNQINIYYNDGSNKTITIRPKNYNDVYEYNNDYLSIILNNNYIDIYVNDNYIQHTSTGIFEIIPYQSSAVMTAYKINPYITPTFIFDTNTDYYIQPYIPNYNSKYFVLSTILNLTDYEKYYLYVYTTETIEIYDEFYKGKSSFNKEFVSYSRINQTATSPATISGTYPITDGNNNRKVNLYKFVLPKIQDYQSYNINYISQNSNNLEDTSKNIYFKYIILTDDSDYLQQIDQQYQIGQFNGIYNDYIDGSISASEAIENLTDISNELIINDNTTPDERQFYIAYYDYTKTKIQENEINNFNQEQYQEYDDIIDKLEEFESIENLVKVPDLDDIRLEFNFPSEWANLSIDVWDISSSLNAIGAAEVIKSIFEIPIIMYLITLSLTLGIISLIVYGRRYT